MRRLADLARRVWKGEIRGLVWATVDNKRRVNCRWYLINSPDCPYDSHMPVAMAEYLLDGILNETGHTESGTTDLE